MRNKKSNERDYFGDCPECGSNDGYLNIFKANWMVCHKHKKKWLIGEDLFSSWRDETEEDWKKNFERIKDYEEVEPLRPALTEEEKHSIEEEQRLREYALKYGPIYTGENLPF